MDQSQLGMEKGKVIFDRVMARIGTVLTQEDLKMIEVLDEKDDEMGNMVQNFLKAKVPNFDAIMKEEVEKYLSEQKSA